MIILLVGKCQWNQGIIGSLNTEWFPRCWELERVPSLWLHHACPLTTVSLWSNVSRSPASSVLEEKPTSSVIHPLSVLGIALWCCCLGPSGSRMCHLVSDFRAQTAAVLHNTIWKLEWRTDPRDLHPNWCRGNSPYTSEAAWAWNGGLGS